MPHAGNTLLRSFKGRLFANMADNEIYELEDMDSNPKWTKLTNRSPASNVNFLLIYESSYFALSYEKFT